MSFRLLLSSSFRTCIYFGTTSYLLRLNLFVPLLAEPECPGEVVDEPGQWKKRRSSRERSTQAKSFLAQQGVGQPERRGRLGKGTEGVGDVGQNAVAMMRHAEGSSAFRFHPLFIPSSAPLQSSFVPWSIFWSRFNWHSFNLNTNIFTGWSIRIGIELYCGDNYSVVSLASHWWWARL